MSDRRFSGLLLREELGGGGIMTDLRKSDESAQRGWEG